MVGRTKKRLKIHFHSHEYILIYVKNQEFLKSNDITWRERKPGLDDIYNCYRKLAKRYGADYETISLELRQWYKGLPNGHPAKDSSHYCKVGSEASVAHLNITGSSNTRQNNVFSATPIKEG